LQNQRSLEKKSKEGPESSEYIEPKRKKKKLKAQLFYWALFLFARLRILEKICSGLVLSEASFWMGALCPPDKLPTLLVPRRCLL